MSSFSLFGIGGNNPNAKDSAVVNAKTGETAPALPRWERNNSFWDYAAPKRIVQETGTQYGRICPQCGEPSVVGAHEMRVFSLLYVIPIMPMGSRNIWGCGRCGWRQERGKGADPAKQDVPDGVAPVLLEASVAKRAAEVIAGKD
ncbi:uncharacterized protein LOC62_03G004346 [Vanrija pseudolonga]|uniref:Zinc-ribbon 15 domain-containing protein n=1 Tax=Vanrija pseudolonga TaxID=143232 RepID=A0AAF1BQD7_9TREE|nr:hypothetical protein LOC62_03G004346 [Vanrija pseudolonga]